MPKHIPKRIRLELPDRPLTLHKPELMAPAGDWDCVRAAVENGADAVYFGLDRFNARMRANNFTRKDLPELMAFLHHRGAKGYLTFNTLVFTDELGDATQFLKSVIASGVDAAIVQDVGMCRLIRQLSPDFPIHASTQMSISSEAGVHFAHELGASVAVLARECSLQEIAAIHGKTEASGLHLPIEIFVHGALCVAYSGQCLTSESLGGRSANRGECAQACRLPYDLIADGKRVPLGDKRYLLSPQDLAGVDLIPDIIRAGVQTLKIEGRLKTPEYVAAVTRVYRAALDHAWQQLAEQSPVAAIPSDDRYTLEMTFSRGLDTGWLEGIDNQRLVHGRFGKKRGVRIGVVQEVTRSGVCIAPEAAVKTGDGIVFDAGKPDVREQGGRISRIDSRRNGLYLEFFNDTVDLDQVEVGQLVWKTSDPALEREIRKSYEVEQPQFRRAVQARVSGRPGMPLQLTLSDEAGVSVTVASEQVLVEATQRPLDADTLRKQLGRLGGTPYLLEALQIEIEGDCMLAMSALNQLRRDAVERLDVQRRKPREWQLDHQFTLPLRTFETPTPHPKAHFIPFVRNWEQLEALLALPHYAEIYLELENPRDYAKAVQHVRSRQADVYPRRVWVAPPRMFKEGEDWILEKLLQSDADGYLVRNHEHLRALQDQRLRGDFSLNVANPLSADWLMERWKLERLTASYDLNHQQLLELLRHSPANRFEITLHQHMPMFHMEHCVFCAFLTDGKDFRDCGRPCDTQQVVLRDRVGMSHPLKADAGCRNTLFNAKAQSGADYLHAFIDAGVSAFRIEFLNESPEEVVRTLSHYERLLRREISADAIWKDLKLINQLGVTRGTLK